MQNNQSLVEKQSKEQVLINVISELVNNQNPMLQKWLPRKLVMDFFEYGDTQMTSMQKQYNLVTQKIGKRIFYRTDSVLNLLDATNDY